MIRRINGGLVGIGIALAVALLLILAVDAAAPTAADHQTNPTAVDIVAADMDISGNAAQTVGTIEDCGEIASTGGTLQFDLVLDQVPNFDGAAGGLGGYSGSILYDQSIITIQAYEALMIFTAAPAGVPIIFGTDAAPDTDGTWTFSFGELAGGIEEGEGVAIRLTAEAVGNGVSDIELTSIRVRDATGVDHTVNSVADGSVVVGGDCSEVPTPTPTTGVTATPTTGVTATPTTGVTATPTTGVTATPTTGVTATPTATASPTGTATASSSATASPGALPPTGGLGDEHSSMNRLVLLLALGGAIIVASTGGFLVARAARKE